MAVIGARPARGFHLLPPRRRVPAARRGRPARRSGADRRREVTSVTGLLVAIIAAATLALFYLSQSSHVAATGYQIDSLEARVAQLRADQQQLILQIGEAQSPSVIQQRATDWLHLAPIPQKSVTFAPTSTDPPY